MLDEIPIKIQASYFGYFREMNGYFIFFCHKHSILLDNFNDVHVMIYLLFFSLSCSHSKLSFLLVYLFYEKIK